MLKLCCIYLLYLLTLYFSHLISAADYGSNHLLKANVLLINQEKCSEDTVYGSILDNSMICAGHLQGGVDSCQVSRGNLQVNQHAIIQNICMDNSSVASS